MYKYSELRITKPGKAHPDGSFFCGACHDAASRDRDPLAKHYETEEDEQDEQEKDNDGMLPHLEGKANLQTLRQHAATEQHITSMQVSHPAAFCISTLPVHVASVDNHCVTHPFFFLEASAGHQHISLDCACGAFTCATHAANHCKWSHDDLQWSMLAPGRLTVHTATCACLVLTKYFTLVHSSSHNATDNAASRELYSPAHGTQATCILSVQTQTSCSATRSRKQLAAHEPYC